MRRTMPGDACLCFHYLPEAETGKSNGVLRGFYSTESLRLSRIYSEGNRRKQRKRRFSEVLIHTKRMLAAAPRSQSPGCRSRRLVLLVSFFDSEKTTDGG